MRSAVAPSTAAFRPRARCSRRVHKAVRVRAEWDGYKDHGPGYSGSDEKLALEPIGKIEGTVTLPGSKSMSNRILLLSALAEGKTKVLNLLDSDDIRYMVDALKTLGLTLTEDRENNILEIEGCAGKIPVKGAELFLGNAGTAMRPLTAAVAAAGEGTFVLDGVERMHVSAFSHGGSSMMHSSASTPSHAATLTELDAMTPHTRSKRFDANERHWIGRL